MFAAAAAQGARQRKENVTVALEEIGKSFDPMFASRVASAFGLIDDDQQQQQQQEKEEGKQEEEQPAPAAVAVDSFPKSLAEVHGISKSKQRFGSYVKCELFLLKKKTIFFF